MSGRLATLCRLQWILAWRQSRGTPYERIFFLAVLVPSMAVTAAGGAFAVFQVSRRVAGESPYHMGLLLMGIGGFLASCYLLSLVLERNSTLGVDFSRLSHFPVPPGAVVASQIFGYTINPLFMGFPAVLFLGCTAGILASGRYLLAFGALAGAALWVVQLALVLTVGELLKLQIRVTPQWARVALIVILLVGVTALVVWVSLGGADAEESPFAGAGALAKRLWRDGRGWIVLLPGISPLSWIGAGWRSAGALPAALLEIAGLGWASSVLVRRLMREGITVPAARRSTERSPAVPARPHLWERFIWWPHFARELRCTLRDRSQVVGIISLCFMVFLLPRLAEETGPLGEGFSRFAVPFAVASLLAFGTLNQFGLSATSLPLVLNSPAPRWTVLLAKNLVGFLLLLLFLAGQETIRFFHGAGAVEIGADLLFGFGTLAVLTGLGNYFSILFPYPAAVPGKNLFPQVSQARLMVISLCQLVFMGIAGNALLPVLAGRLVLFQFADSPRIWSLAAGAMLLYAACLYGLLLAGAGRVLLRLEPHLFEKLQKSNA